MSKLFLWQLLKVELVEYFSDFTSEALLLSRHFVFENTEQDLWVATIENKGTDRNAPIVHLVEKCSLVWQIKCIQVEDALDHLVQQVSRKNIDWETLD